MENKIKKGEKWKIKKEEIEDKVDRERSKIDNLGRNYELCEEDKIKK